MTTPKTWLKLIGLVSVLLVLLLRYHFILEDSLTHTSTLPVTAPVTASASLAPPAPTVLPLPPPSLPSPPLVPAAPYRRCVDHWKCDRRFIEAGCFGAIWSPECGNDCIKGACTEAAAWHWVQGLDTATGKHANICCPDRSTAAPAAIAALPWTRSVLDLAEEQLRGMIAVDLAKIASDPVLDPRGPCAGIVGAGHYKGQACAARWCCVAAANGVSAANRWCDHLAHFGCFIDPDYPPRHDNGSADVSMCPERCRRIREITDREPLRPARMENVLHLLRSDGLTMTKAHDMLEMLGRNQLAELMSVGRGQKPRTKMSGRQGPDPCQVGGWRWVVEGGLISDGSFKSCNHSGSGAVRLDEVVFGVPTMERRGTFGKKENVLYLPKVIDSILEYADPSRVYLMKAGNKMAEHSVRFAGATCLCLRLHLTAAATEPSFCGVFCLQTMDSVLRLHPSLNVVDSSSVEKQLIRHHMHGENYSLPANADFAMKIALQEGPQKRGWRLSEASDFIFLMSELLTRSDAPYIGFHQDDAEWTQPPEILGAPIQSLYQFRPGGPIAAGDTQMGIGIKCITTGICNCALACGMVSMVFRRDVLQQFLGAIKPGAWKLKPIDMLLNDFLTANGFEWPATRSVQHKGSTSSYIPKGFSSRDELVKVAAHEFRDAPPITPRPGREEWHKVYSCARAPPETVPTAAGRKACAC